MTGPERPPSGRPNIRRHILSAGDLGRLLSGEVAVTSPGWTRGDELGCEIVDGALVLTVSEDGAQWGHPPVPIVVTARVVD